MEILVPTSINDITLEQYQKFYKINTENQEEEFFIFKTIEIFCGIDMKTISKFPFKDAKAISEDILGVLDQTVPFQDRFELNGIKYGFIPDLQAMSLGEFIDLEESLRDTKDFHIAASVMYRPVTKEFKEIYAIDGYEANKSIQMDMKGAPIGIISAAIVFFYNIVNELLMVSQDFSQKEKERISTILEKLNSQKNTAGLTQYTHFVEVMRQSME